MGKTSEEILREKCLDTPIGIGVKKIFKEFDTNKPMFDSYRKKVIHYYKAIQDETLTESHLFKTLYREFDIHNGDYTNNFFADIVDSVIISEYNLMGLNVIKENDHRRYLNACGKSIADRIEEYFNIRRDKISKDDIFCSEEHIVGKIKDSFDFNTLDKVGKNKLNEHLEIYTKDLKDIRESISKGDESRLADERYAHMIYKILKKTARTSLGYVDGLFSDVPVDIATDDEKFREWVISLDKSIEDTERRHNVSHTNRFARVLSKYFGETRIHLNAVKKAKHNYLGFIKRHGVTKFWTAHKEDGRMFEVNIEDPQGFYNFFTSVKFSGPIYYDVNEPPVGGVHELWILGNWVYDYDHLNLKPLANLSPSTMELILAVEMYYENEVEFVKDIIKTTGNDVLLGILT